MKFQKSNRSAFINFLRAKYETWTGEALTRSLPYIVGIDPSSICQLRCPICPTGVENESKRKGQNLGYRNRTLLAPDLFEALINELGEYLFLVMFYNWGEPLLNKNLPTMIKKAKALEIYTEIHSNLSLNLSDEFIEELLNSGVDEIAASIDGFSASSYQEYRQGGIFELAKSNLERLSRTRDRLGIETKIIWNYLVFSFNEQELDATRQFCDQHGIIFNRREAFIDRPEWLPSYRKGELDSPIPPSDSAKITRSRAGRTAACAWHYSYTMINADGSISPCCAPWEQKYDFGKIEIGNIAFSDIWNNNNYRKSRGAFAGKPVKGLEKLNTLCLKCPYDTNIQNLYSFHETEIRNRFAELPDVAEPLLKEAFRLLDSEREFSEFFGRNLVTDFSTTWAPEDSGKRRISFRPEIDTRPASLIPSRLIAFNNQLRHARSILRHAGLRALLLKIRVLAQRRFSSLIERQMPSSQNDRVK